jgi:exopolysaccharide biosynthesis polyprenyl glycosylphosphotransferase
MYGLDGQMDAGPMDVAPVDVVRHEHAGALATARAVESAPTWVAGHRRCAGISLGPWVFAIGDAVAVGMASLLAIVENGPALRTAPTLLILPLATLVLLAAHGVYRAGPRLTPFAANGPAAVAVTVAAMCAVATEHLRHPEEPDPAPVLVAWPLALGLLIISRGAFGAGEHLVRSRGRQGTPTLIVGTGEVGVRIAERLLAGRGYGLRPIGFLDDDPPVTDAASERPLPVLGGLGDLADVVATAGVQHVVFAFSAAPDRELRSVVRECERLGVGVALVPRLFDCVNHRTSYEPLGGLPVLTLRSTDPRGWGFATKHAFDRVVAAAGLFAFAPLGVAIALAVRLSSPGPVLFSQVRVGRDGQVFKMLKFRTMRDADVPTSFAPRPGLAPGGVEGDDRRTGVGRFLRRTSLDELPQLWNVLLGHMSLVGPRPERPQFVDQFAVELSRYDERHRVRSGLTGLAQVRGLRGQSSIADRVELDNFYIEHWSFGFDLKLMVLTLVAIVRSGG